MAGHWSGVGGEDGCAINDRRVGEHAKDCFCRRGKWLVDGSQHRGVFSMYALDVTCLSAYRVGQSWSTLQALRWVV